MSDKGNDLYAVYVKIGATDKAIDEFNRKPYDVKNLHIDVLSYIQGRYQVSKQ